MKQKNKLLFKYLASAFLSMYLTVGWVIFLKNLMIFIVLPFSLDEFSNLMLYAFLIINALLIYVGFFLSKLIVGLLEVNITTAKGLIKYEKERHNPRTRKDQ